MSRPTLKERIGWYPVSTLGWLLTIIYTCLLIYALVQTMLDLYSVNVILFRTAILISWLVILVMLWARYTNECPFRER
jgi:hypothetical protein